MATVSQKVRCVRMPERVGVDFFVEVFREVSEAFPDFISREPFAIVRSKQGRVRIVPKLKIVVDVKD